MTFQIFYFCNFAEFLSLILTVYVQILSFLTMEIVKITVIIVSKMSSEVIDTVTVFVKANVQTHYQFMNLEIHKCYPHLYETEYRIYWVSGENEYMEVKDYHSYIMMLQLSLDHTLYLLVNDCPSDWTDNGDFLIFLDELEEFKEKESRRTLYDLYRPGDETLESFMLKEPEWSGPQRSDGEIIKYSTRNYPSKRCFTSDWEYLCNLSDVLKKGISYFLL